MGILNLTPDSFSDGGKYQDFDAALRHAESMSAAGAAIIDVGGESTRPGSAGVSVEQELDRVVAVIEFLSRNLDVVLSVDTSKPAVMAAALEAGATMINDVNALRSEGAIPIAAASGVPVCLMHMLGEPRTMQIDPAYDDVVVEVRNYLADRAAACVAGGVDDQQIILDPGFGFGKNVGHNMELLRRLGDLSDGYPVMAGLSRKSMIGKLLGLPMERRVHASVALAMIAVANGARLLRVHDVGPTLDAVRMYESVYLDQCTPSQILTHSE
jgi:dihydropteroate synthase